jgi:hypothetical protein
VDHIAFEIGLEDFDAQRRCLQELGQAVQTAEHAWAHWQWLDVSDPEGNAVELVCHDPAVG